jgi:cell wall-associated NlpC family hydrolase
MPGTTASPRPVESPVPPTLPGSPHAPASASRALFDAYALAGTALALRGAPYRDGGTDPSGFDCSGFTQYVFAQYGVSLPREVRDQFRWGKAVKPEELATGDLIFFTTTEPGASHVAIAVGGDEFVHAPSSAGVVRVERLNSNYWGPRFLGARRGN